MDNTYALLFASTLNAGTVLAIAALGELISEKGGVLNLGVEGMMLCAAIAGFAVTVHTGSDVAGFLGGMAVGVLLAAVFGWLVIWLGANQYATGLALMLFGSGLSAFLGVNYVQATLPDRAKFDWLGLGDVPILGPALFRLHPLVYLTMLLTGAMIWWLYRTRSGLVLRSVGEAPESANALGYPVRRIRLLAVLFGGAMSGLAGAYLSLVYTPLWTEGMVAGRGWIALALVVFGTWRPLRVLLGAYLFGGVTMLQFFLQSEGVPIPTEFLATTPYLATIIVLALISRNATWIRLNMPASLGKAFSPAG